MNHPLVAAVSGVFFGCVLSFSAYLVHLRPDPMYNHSEEAVVVRVPVQAVVSPPAPSSDSIDSETPETFEDCASPDATLRAAQHAYVYGDYDEAINLAELCVEVEPHRALRIIGAASCVVHDLECLKTAYLGLDAPGRQFLVYTCQRNGVSFHQRGKHLIAKVNKD